MAHNPWRDSVQRGLAPVSLGLLLAGCITIGLEVLTDWINILLCLVVFGLLMKTKINPSLLIFGCCHPRLAHVPCSGAICDKVI